jgi:hypothetical protein
MHYDDLPTTSSAGKNSDGAKRSKLTGKERQQRIPDVDNKECNGRHRFLRMISTAAVAIILISLLFQNSTMLFSSSQSTTTKLHGRAKTSLRSAYSLKEAIHSEVWIFNRHELRRRRRRSTDVTSTSSSKFLPHGIARDCGLHCSFRLRAGDVRNGNEQHLRVHFTRWKTVAKPRDPNLPDITNGQVVPLIQYIDSDNQTHARMSRTSPDCIYSARVHGATEHSIVNLCDVHGGIFGTLALPEGAFIIEPLVDNGTTQNVRRKRSVDRRHHIIYKASSHSFEKPLDSAQQNDETFRHIDTPAETETSQSYANNSEYVDIRPRKVRSRRSANSWDHFVEVLVVADFQMLVYHGRRLEDYLITLFSTVASIYRHPSLRASINIIVVKILVLKDESYGPRISNRAQETLQQFCAWQQTHNDLNDDSVNHHDVAILLTRHDICRATNKCDTLGLAELGTMCDFRKSCAIIEDNGLSAAFTIAHELGHIFNIPHDDERRCGDYMQLNKHNFHIMAPTLEYNTNPWSWSLCSAGMLGKFLDTNRGQTQCILDQPIERRYFDQMFEYPAAGATYSVREQCQYVFGPSADICPYMPTCRRLWCSTYQGSQMGCRTQHMPWADGTECGKGMWCHRGQCVGMAPDQRPKQDGAWGEWKPWGECSRTCGGGVQKALRDCDHPRYSFNAA